MLLKVCIEEAIDGGEGGEEPPGRSVSVDPIGDPGTVDATDSGGDEEYAELYLRDDTDGVGGILFLNAWARGTWGRGRSWVKLGERAREPSTSCCVCNCAGNAEYLVTFRGADV